MIETMIESFTDAIIDTAKLIPFLYITYLIMEFIERKAADKSTETLASVGRLGPIFGGIVGVIPQCGFSASAASLYSGGILSIGTLLAVFLSTSDEMLPIFISEHLEAGSIFRILAVKAAIGVISGLIFFSALQNTSIRPKRESMICVKTNTATAKMKKREISFWRR